MATFMDYGCLPIWLLMLNLWRLVSICIGSELSSFDTIWVSVMRMSHLLIPVGWVWVVDGTFVSDTNQVGLYIMRGPSYQHQDGLE